MQPTSAPARLDETIINLGGAPSRPFCCSEPRGSQAHDHKASNGYSLVCNVSKTRFESKTQGVTLPIAPTEAPPARPRRFYGWVIVWVTFVINIVASPLN